MRRRTIVLLCLAVTGAIGSFFGCQRSDANSPPPQAAAPSPVATTGTTGDTGTAVDMTRYVAVSPCSTTPIPNVTFASTAAPDTCVNPGNYTQRTWRTSEAGTSLTSINIPDWTQIPAPYRPPWSASPILLAPCSNGTSNSCSTTTGILNSTIWTVIPYSITMTNGGHTNTIYGHIIIKP